MAIAVFMEILDMYKEIQWIINKKLGILLLVNCDNNTKNICLLMDKDSNLYVLTLWFIPVIHHAWSSLAWSWAKYILFITSTKKGIGHCKIMFYSSR